MKEKIIKSLQILLMAFVLMLTAIGMPALPGIDSGVAFAQTGSTAKEISWTDWRDPYNGGRDLQTPYLEMTGILTRDSREITVTAKAKQYHSLFADRWLNDLGIVTSKPPTHIVGAEVKNLPTFTYAPRMGLTGANSGITITFSEPVQDPLLVIKNWFPKDYGSISDSSGTGILIEIVNQGPTLPQYTAQVVLNDTKDGFLVKGSSDRRDVFPTYQSGVANAVIRVPGVYKSFDFNNTRIHNDAYQGGIFTVGVADIVEVYNDIVNIDSVTNSSKAQAVKVTLPAGNYTISVVGKKDGGTYDAWTKNTKVKGCDGNGKNCTQGWEHKYLYQLGAGKKVKIKGTGRYETPALALANLPDDVTFTLTEPTEAIFYLKDTNDASNNQGGLSLHIVGKE
ncbi:MAG: hypothetical protein AAGA60_23370 [Cyanobacteria bacterium P01_E01_bin.42]